MKMVRGHFKNRLPSVSFIRCRKQLGAISFQYSICMVRKTLLIVWTDIVPGSQKDAVLERVLPTECSG